jgi:NADP-dependent aldehyde dehydrogenase
MLSVTGKNAVGYTDFSSGDTVFYRFNPADGTALPKPFFQATMDETNMAVVKATAAFESYNAIPFSGRKQFLYGIANALRENREELIRLFCLESGLTQYRAEKELERSCFQFESYADAVESGYALEVKIDQAVEHEGAVVKPDLRKMNVPLGPVVVFGASNFPFAYSTIGGDVASALAAGCPVIVKGHPMHPHTSEYAGRIILSVANSFGLPDGVFSHLHAIDYTVGEQLVKHPGIKAVGFTGSIKGGMALHRLSQLRTEPIPVYAEMGSSNPIVVTQDAIINRGNEIAQMIAQSVGLDAGQFCTSPGLLFLIGSHETEEFLGTLAENLREIPEQVMLHRGIFDQYVKQAGERSAGADMLVDGKRQDIRITPSLLRISGELMLAEPGRQEEVFGSFITAVICTDHGQLLDCLQQLHGQLTASLFAESGEDEMSIWLQMQRFSGRIILNGVPTGVTVALAMQHGGPFPASNQPYFSAVGADAVKRFMRPVAFQNAPDGWLPDALKRANPLGILRFVNGLMTKSPC